MAFAARVAAAGFRGLLGRGQRAPAGAGSVREPLRASASRRALWDGVRLPPQPVPVPAARGGAVPAAGDRSPTAPRRSLFTGAAVASWLLTARIVARRPGGRREGAAAVLIAGALFFPLYLHLERGQIDLLLAAAGASRRGCDAIASSLAGGVLVLAATFKPALLGLLPVMFALGYRRWALATIACCAVAAARHARDLRAAPGPRVRHRRAAARRALRRGRHRRHAAARTGRCKTTTTEGERVGLEGVSYRIAVPPFDGPASASLPRLIAPRSPTG